MSFVDRIKRIGQPDVDADLADLEPDPYAVPPELAEYWPHTTGLDEQTRARITADGGHITMHPIRTQRIGVREDIRPPETLTLAQYEHQTRLEQAAHALRSAEFQRVVHAGDLPCGLCGQVHAGGQLAALQLLDGRELRLCGTCCPLVKAEVDRREWAERIASLLDSDSTQPT